MRDIAFSLVFLAFWLQCFARPYLGPLLWAWVSMMYPHRLAFGFAHNLPVAFIAGLTTLGMFAVSREKQPFPRNAPAILMVLFFIWCCVTSLASINDPTMVYGVWLKVAKIQLMLFVTMMMLSGRQQITWLVWIIALSLGFYGFKGGLYTLKSAGLGQVLGPPGSFIEPNNEIGLALVMVVPLLYFLYGISTKRWVRLGLLAVAILTLVAILGTYSRAAFLAVAVMVFFLAMKSNHKAFTIVVMVAGLAGTITFLPDRWTERMHSISTYQDDSAQTRLQVWAICAKVAADHPITGGGYRITENPKIWEQYAKGDWKIAFVPHSIYFQALAEHGYVGLILFLGIGLSTLRLASKVAREAREGPDADWVPLLMGMIQASIIGYSVAGAFSALVNYDLPYYLAAIVAMVARDMASRRPALAAPTATFPSPAAHGRLGGEVAYPPAPGRVSRGCRTS
ncbi:MAG TPA: putative O-glycosylation ligase, exosortase A system-associated [Rhodocyclaceae bacterium]|nr:putative O-glycosylation ligase, exosortase A system-associated [Rhodocyclaceae bacterium]